MTKRILICSMIVCFALAGCAAPKPKTVDGTMRVPVNKVIPPAGVEKGTVERS